jgi:hypothetical protein
MHPTAPGDPSTPRLGGSQVKFSSFFQFRIQILTHESKYHVIEFSYGSNTYNVVGEVLPQPSRLRRGRQCLQSSTKDRVSALLPHIQARDTSYRRGHLHLKGKPRHGECLRG